MGLIGVFKTIAEGRDPGGPNCFLFPLRNGAWRVYRFSPGVKEHDTWTQDGNGWTTCYFNRFPDLAAACGTCGGVEDSEHGEWVFSATRQAVEAATMMGQPLKVEPALLDRRATLKPTKDGRMRLSVARLADETVPGWLDKKDRLVRTFNARVQLKEDEQDFNEYDRLVRCLKTPANQDAGWVTKEASDWVHRPASTVKMMLQKLGHAKEEAEAIMGGAGWESWKVVNLPFREEYPGGRQWNMDAAQFRFKPAELGEDEVPCHPNWDKICEHIGKELTPALKDLPWAAEANIRTGADYIRSWIACAFRDPFEPAPFLYLFGPHNSGKSILHEGLMLLVTKGVNRADRPLKHGVMHNGELANAVIAVVEETDLRCEKGAYNKIKDWVTGRTISIRRMRTDSYDQPNTLHWIMCANEEESCPIFPGDNRVTAIYVPDDVPKDDKIPKKMLLKNLEDEAPHFMYTIMHMELPPLVDRLRLPALETADKERLVADNSPLGIFVQECCVFGPKYKVLKSDLMDACVEWSRANGFDRPQNPTQFGRDFLVSCGRRARASKLRLGPKRTAPCYLGVRLRKRSQAGRRVRGNAAGVPASLDRVKGRQPNLPSRAQARTNDMDIPDMDTPTVETAVRLFIAWAFVPAKRRYPDSNYGLKHEVEHIWRELYVPEQEFVRGMVEAGFRATRDGHYFYVADSPARKAYDYDWQRFGHYDLPHPLRHKRPDPATEFARLPSAEQQELLTWISERLRPTKRRKLPASVLACGWPGSKANGQLAAFCGAMLAAGYQPVNPLSYEWDFHATLK